MKTPQDLTRDFPELFPNAHPDGSPLLSVSFSMPRGWSEIIYDLCFKIVSHCEEEGFDPPVVAQIKSKFGGLRFYTDSGTPVIFQFIGEAEQLSFKTCQICAKPAKCRGYDTLCDEHHEKYETGWRPWLDKSEPPVFSNS